MTNLRNQIAWLIGQFDGADAADRPRSREQLISDLLDLIQKAAGMHAKPAHAPVPVTSRKPAA